MERMQLYLRSLLVFAPAVCSLYLEPYDSYGLFTLFVLLQLGIANLVSWLRNAGRPHWCCWKSGTGPG